MMPPQIAYMGTLLSWAKMLFIDVSPLRLVPVSIGKARMALPCGLFTAYCAPPTGPDTAGRMLDAVR